MYKRTVKRGYWQLVLAETKGRCRTGPWEALAIRTPRCQTQVSTGCSRELSFMVLRPGSPGSQHVLTWRKRPGCDLFRMCDLREQRGHGNTKYCFPKLRVMLKQSLPFMVFLMHQGTARTEQEPAGILGSVAQDSADAVRSRAVGRAPAPAPPLATLALLPTASEKPPCLLCWDLPRQESRGSMRSSSVPGTTRARGNLGAVSPGSALLYAAERAAWQ